MRCALLLLVSVSVVLAAQCDCVAYYEPIPLTTCFDRTTAYVAFVRRLSEAQFLCTNFRALTGQTQDCTVFQWFRLAPTVVRTSQQTTTTLSGLWRIEIGDPLQRGYSCNERGTVLEMGQFEQRPTPTALAWIPGSRCGTPACPTTKPWKTTPAWTRYLTADGKMMCNIGACDSCRCDAASHTCSCGNPLWTGAACEVYRPTACCSPPETPAMYKPGYPVCEKSGGVCRYANDEMAGLEACSASTGCTSCPPDRFAYPFYNGVPALTGPRCNISACSPPCIADRGQCQSQCVDHHNQLRWCFTCLEEDKCEHRGYACRCIQNDQDVYLGARCEISAGGRGFGPNNLDPGYGHPGCQTLPVAPVPWTILNPDEPNGYICAGFGTCDVTNPAAPTCKCRDQRLIATRCFHHNPCVTRCPNNQTRATCHWLGSLTDYDCTCTPLYYTNEPIESAPVERICAQYGCVGSLVDDEGRTLASARAVSSSSCVCPSWQHVHTTWARVKTPEPDDYLGQGRAGCRIQCPVTDLGECGDGISARCSSTWTWLAPQTRVSSLPTLTCDCGKMSGPDGRAMPARVFNSTTGSCDRYCIHGTDVELGNRDKGCYCEQVYLDWLDNGKPFEEQKGYAAIWKGPRCDQSVCEHGGTFPKGGQRCTCVGNWGENEYDTWCRRPRCSAPRTWNATTQLCECTYPYDPVTCALQCVPGHGIAEGSKRCHCLSIYTGRLCEQTLCGPDSIPAPYNDSCICPHPEITSGRFCNVSHCDPLHTKQQTPSACICRSPLFAGPTCAVDRCSALYPQSGEAVADDKGVWSCRCRESVYPQLLAPGSTLQVCGCPDATRLLDRCGPEDDGVDPRCVLRRGSETWRCICPYGQVEREPQPSSSCVDLACHPDGTDPLTKYRLVAGVWSCACKPQWSGERCEIHRPPPRCGNGTYDGTKCVCPPPHTRLVHDPNVGAYCALLCRHGIYNLAQTACECFSAHWTGPLCDQTAPIPPRPSNDTNPSNERDELAGLSAPAVSATLGVAIVIVSVGILLIIVLLTTRRSASRTVSNEDRHPLLFKSS
jgi:hypothetical protein